MAAHPSSATTWIWRCRDITRISPTADLEILEPRQMGMAVGSEFTMASTSDPWSQGAVSAGFCWFQVQISPRNSLSSPPAFTPPWRLGFPVETSALFFFCSTLGWEVDAAARYSFRVYAENRVGGELGICPWNGSCLEAGKHPICWSIFLNQVFWWWKLMAQNWLSQPIGGELHGLTQWVQWHSHFLLSWGTAVSWRLERGFSSYTSSSVRPQIVGVLRLMLVSLDILADPFLTSVHLTDLTSNFRQIRWNNS